MGQEGPFSSCKDLGGELELTYGRGTGDTIRFAKGNDGQDVTVSYRVKAYEGQARDAMAHIGRLRLLAFVVSARMNIRDELI